jgi:hypothetical protein
MPQSDDAQYLTGIDLVVARDEIRHTMTSYNRNGDNFDLAGLAAQFAPDGVLQVVGREAAQGRDGIIAALSGSGGRQPEGIPEGKLYIRHFLTNILVENVTATTADSSAYFVVLTPLGPDHWGRYRDKFVKLDEGWRIAHRTVRVDYHVHPAPWFDAGAE